MSAQPSVTTNNTMTQKTDQFEVTKTDEEWQRPLTPEQYQVLRRHATELYELATDERARVMEEVSAVARALQRAFGARKVNYALFGNVLPHMHWHLIPRLGSDPAPRSIHRSRPCRDSPRVT